MGSGQQHSKAVPSPQRAVSTPVLAALPSSGRAVFLFLEEFFGDFELIPSHFFAAHIASSFVAHTG